jgi:large conductance mechanosensitive channel protein
MKKFWREFKEFINKGNVLGLAVGVIIGGAFSTITTSLTNDIIMPIVSIFLGGVDFSTMNLALPTFFPVADEAVPNTLNYGNFISAVINFLILALVVFLIVKAVNKAMSLTKKREEETPPPPPAPSNEEVLLTEIRDLLKANSDKSEK